MTFLLVNEPAIEEPQPGDMNIFFRNHRLIRNRAKRMESKNDAAVTSNATAGFGSAIPKLIISERIRIRIRIRKTEHFHLNLQDQK